MPPREPSRHDHLRAQRRQTREIGAPDRSRAFQDRRVAGPLDRSGDFFDFLQNQLEYRMAKSVYRISLATSKPCERRRRCKWPRRRPGEHASREDHFMAEEPIDSIRCSDPRTPPGRTCVHEKGERLSWCLNRYPVHHSTQHHRRILRGLESRPTKQSHSCQNGSRVQKTHDSESDGTKPSTQDTASERHERIRIFTTSGFVLERGRESRRRKTTERTQPRSR